ncbi:hypothetical protein DTO282F9_3618 [Paecilomyces variotii]|nr:hypothetical protein DTO282F9_3618 [Paecilomyces variotii]
MLPSTTDVLICGAGSAGLFAAGWLARYGLECTVLESSDGPLKLGKADGVQCRTVEIFESLGLSDQLLRESYHVNEVTFWNAGEKGIVRTSRTADTPIGLSHMPHVILNQARINSLMIEYMKKWNNQQDITYGWAVTNVHVDKVSEDDLESYPVTVTAQKDGVEHKIKAKYALGCDGAHSTVRKCLGYTMVGDTTDSVWGVMDVYPQTDFPDIRKKAALKSAAGSLLIIPREGGSMVRLYIELPHGTKPKEVRVDDLQATAKRIFAPYSLDIVETFWWSAYSIGQRLADHFDKDYRVFLTGDACHTHSPKAGQGMNVSLQDGYNIGWKLAHVLMRRASPSLLRTYTFERSEVAANLIAFDREFTRLFSQKPTSTDAPDSFSKYFIQSANYTAGLTSKYKDSQITDSANSKQECAPKIVVGMRLPTAQVVRHSDSYAMQLLRALVSDGRWRLILFPGDVAKQQTRDRLRNVAKYLESEKGPIRSLTPRDQDLDSVIEVLLVVKGDRFALEQKDIPEIYRPVNGKWRMRDPDKIYFDDESHNHGHGHAYETYGIDPERGALVVVRPDQYVSMVVDPNNVEAVGKFFQGWANTPTARL